MLFPTSDQRRKTNRVFLLFPFFCDALYPVLNLRICQRASPMARACRSGDTWSIAGLMVQRHLRWHGHLSTACPRYPSVGYVDSTSALPTPYLSGFRGAIRSIAQSLGFVTPHQAQRRRSGQDKIWKGRGRRRRVRCASFVSCRLAWPLPASSFLILASEKNQELKQGKRII